MSTSSPYDDELGFDDWLHSVLVDAYGMDDETWSTEIVTRTRERINGVLRSSIRLVPVVLWLRPLIAFTAPGRYVYVSRRLLERALPEDAVAMIMAHEAAHHELGHVELFQGWLKHLPRTGPSILVAAAFRIAERRLYGPQRELDADARGLELCLAAGYDGRLGLRLFDILSDDGEDHGDLAGAYGPEEEIDPLTADRPLSQAIVWVWEHFRGYPSLRKRRELLRARLEDVNVRRRGA